MIYKRTEDLLAAIPLVQNGIAECNVMTRHDHTCHKIPWDEKQFIVQNFYLSTKMLHTHLYIVLLLYKNHTLEPKQSYTFIITAGTQ